MVQFYSTKIGQSTNRSAYSQHTAYNQGIQKQRMCLYSLWCETFGIRPSCNEAMAKNAVRCIRVQSSQNIVSIFDAVAYCWRQYLSK